jgi:hypothetical protein
MKVTELAIDLTLKTLLFELTRDGVRYAQLHKEYTESNSRGSMIEHDKLDAISSILASILPGVCPAQVQKGFQDFAATGVFPYGHMDMDDVEKLLASIDAAWKEKLNEGKDT